MAHFNQFCTGRKFPHIARLVMLDEDSQLLGIQSGKNVADIVFHAAYLTLKVLPQVHCNAHFGLAHRNFHLRMITSISVFARNLDGSACKACSSSFINSILAA